MLTWAIDRSGVGRESLHRRFPKLDSWEAGHFGPTFNQLQNFASATHAPLGYLFLNEPPHEELPIPDFRTVGNASVDRPSPDLLDTVYLCQVRQDWFREHALAEGHSPLAFVGSVAEGDPVEPVAEAIRGEIGFDLDSRGKFSSPDDALRQLIDLIEDLGVLVMISGIVGSNTHRALDVREFRGFALADSLAPLIFVNGADTKAAQIFTLIHELVHIWAGETALSDARMATRTRISGEAWANQVAAEVLVPASRIARDYEGTVTRFELERLAKLYKVSTLVVLKRIHDAGFLAWDTYQDLYARELDRITSLLQARRGGTGGNYYYTQPLRISRHFARAVIVDAKEGRTLYRDAYRLLGTAKHQTFENLAAELGVR